MLRTYPVPDPSRPCLPGVRRALADRPWRWLRVALLCVLPVLLVIGGCSGCEEDDPKPQPAADLPPVPAPEHHVADIYMPTPAETFKNIRNRVGGPLALLPGSFPSMMVTVLGLSPQMLEQIDGKSPAFGVVTDDGKRTVVVMGVHVRSGPRTVDLLTKGADAKYEAKPAKDGVVLLAPKPSLRSRAAALAVAGNYLLSAERAEDVKACGAYVSRTLPKRGEQEGDIVLIAPASALRGPIAGRIRNGWSSFRTEREKEDEKLRKTKGRAPDFGEPAAALADVEGKIDSVVDLLGDLENARLRIDTGEIGIHAKLEMSPASKDGVAVKEFSSLATGDIEPLLAMPRDTVLGVLLRDRAKARVEGAKGQADGLAELLGARLGDDENKAVMAGLTALAKGRGDWMAAALRWTRREQEAIVRGSVSDPEAMDEGIRALLGLSDVDAFREPVEARLGEMAFGKMAKSGNGHFVHVERKKKVPEGAAPRASAFDIAWRIDVEAKRFEVRAGEKAKDLLSGQDEPSQVPRLGKHPTTSKIFSGIGKDVSFALFVDPQLFVASLAPKRAKVKDKNAPFVFAYGGNREQGWCKVVLSNASAREIVKILGRNATK